MEHAQAMTLANGLREPAQIGDTALGGRYRLAPRTLGWKVTSTRFECLGCAADHDRDLCDRLCEEAHCGVGVWHPITEQTEMKLETKGEE